MAQIQTFYFEEGNTVRKEAQVLPQRRDLPLHEDKRRRELEEKARRRARARAIKKAKRQSFALAVATVITCALLVVLVNLQNSITTRMENVATLKNQLTALKADNAATESRIASAANLAAVKNIASNELHMVYANSDQIVYYSMDSTDYMSQYNDIP